MKKIIVTPHDNAIKIPNKYILLIVEIKSGAIDVIKYIAKAKSLRELGKLSIYSI